jgi:hypothetical protein
MSDEPSAPAQHPLNAFADKWALDGDLIRCRACNRPQHVSYSLHPFHHRSGCVNERAASASFRIRKEAAKVMP